jgi:hypothetical protein
MQAVCCHRRRRRRDAARGAHDVAARGGDAVARAWGACAGEGRVCAQQQHNADSARVAAGKSGTVGVRVWRRAPLLRRCPLAACTRVAQGCRGARAAPKRPRRARGWWGGQGAA